MAIGIIGILLTVLNIYIYNHHDTCLALSPMQTKGFETWFQFHISTLGIFAYHILKRNYVAK
ncbi:hypothetical protein CLU79DRAFT_730497 [Phycomyces nitens]|nr:hypothetical protein CLU79DRAFT_730497 [Phycomyces nitens]